MYKKLYKYTFQVNRNDFFFTSYKFKNYNSNVLYFTQNITISEVKEFDCEKNIMSFKISFLLLFFVDKIFYLRKFFKSSMNLIVRDILHSINFMKNVFRYL